MKKRYTIAAASGAGQPCPLTSENGGLATELAAGGLLQFNHFQVQLTAGTVRVFASLDGINYPSRPLVLSLEPAVDGSDVVTEPQGTFIAQVTSTLARIHHFFGTYQSLKILQVGGTGAVGVLLCSER